MNKWNSYEKYRNCWYKAVMLHVGLSLIMVKVISLHKDLSSSIYLPVHLLLDYLHGILAVFGTTLFHFVCVEHFVSFVFVVMSQVVFQSFVRATKECTNVLELWSKVSSVQLTSLFSCNMGHHILTCLNSKHHALTL